MNDPLKDFVERNREEFDQLDAPQFNLDLFKKQKEVPVQQKTKPAFLQMGKWLAAAVILLVVAGSFLIFRTSSTKHLNTQASTTKKTQPVQVVSDLKEPVKAHVAAVMPGRSGNITASKNVNVAQVSKHVYMAEKVDQLTDSSSASNRLALILEIDKSGYISEHMINRLAKTLERDGNSNVRLAALNVMGKYKNDAHVSALLIKSLNSQNDPLVQLELVRVLGTMNNATVDDRLYALVNDPNTLDAVKDEAYMVLMKENKQ
ncbi:HEAT repeat domain-containing protein [Pedobacter frigidisoli]|uniref:HEAT repeat domain-containing protein n=1 Tax=Pedobacter frigidisoli TaxID=2530455 RepID=UPI00292FF2C2|nr:HEAT repeat domain-containing protein [Pedobacter frigidisoli]